MANPNEEVEYGGKKYTMAYITTGIYKAMDLKGGQTSWEQIVVASLKAGGTENAQAIIDEFPAFNDTTILEWIEAAKRVNGFKTKATDTPGEVEAVPVPAK